jgi:hypothetical protein
MQQQWAALEHAYLRGQARAIGVSNYCEQCVRCLLKTAKITPMVNQVQYHIGMGAGYPEVPRAPSESFLRVHWVAVPEALRARLANRLTISPCPWHHLWRWPPSDGCAHAA